MYILLHLTLVERFFSIYFFIMANLVSLSYNDLLPDTGTCTYYWSGFDGGDFGSPLGATCEDYRLQVEFDNASMAVRHCDPDTELVLDRGTVSSSLSVDFGLVCDRQYLRSLLGPTYMLGMLLGSLVLGQVSDSYGRLTAIAASLTVCTLAGVVGALLPSWELFAVSRLLTGFGGVGMYMCPFVLIVEVISSRFSAFVGMLGGVPFAMGEMLLALEAYFIRDWKTLQLVSYGSFALLLPMLLLMSESPRWLLSTGKVGKARKILSQISKGNGRGPFTKQIVMSESNNTARAATSQGTGLGSVFKNKTLLVRLMSVSYQWLCTSMCYYGLIFSSTSLSGDPYSNFAIGALMEIPGYLFVALVMDCWGRRPILVFLQVLPGLCCIGAGLMHGVDHLRIPQLFLSLIGKFGSAGCFNLVYIYTAELFPTGARNSVVGFGSMMGRVGSALSLMGDLLGTVWPPLPMVVLGSATVLAGLLAVLLPETAGRPMPDTVEDALSVGGRGEGGEAMCSCHPSRWPFSKKNTGKDSTSI